MEDSFSEARDGIAAVRAVTPFGVPRTDAFEPLLRAAWQPRTLLAVDGRRRHRLWRRGFATIAYPVAFLIEATMPCQALMGQLAR
jgi:hypothetical protein